VSRERQRVPEWASFFTPGQYRIFMELVEGYWSEQGRPIDVDDGVVRFVDGPSHSLGLGNLSQVCKHCPMDDWPEVVAGHFDRFGNLEAEQEELQRKIHDFEEVAPFLAVRLYHDSVLDDMEGLWVYRRDLEGTITALVFDLPNTVRNIKPEEAEGWGRSEDELFRIGLENTLKSYARDWETEQVDLDEDVCLTLVSGEDFFAPTQALVMERMPELSGTHGALVGIPHRHALLCYPIEDLRVVVAVTRLIPVVMGMHKEGPGSLSPLLYWYREGGFTTLPARVEEEKIVFAPPDDFVDLLNGLAGSGSGDEDDDGDELM